MALLYVSVFTFGCWLLCWSLMQITQDTKEPPVISHAVPYVGNLVGLLRYGLKYFGMISTQYSTSVYTLRLPWKKIYIISSPEVMAAVDRHSNTLSLAPFALEFVKRVTIPSKSGIDILNKNFSAEKGAHSFHSDTVRAMSVALAPGSALEHTTSEMLSGALRFLDSINSSSGGLEIDLFSWTRSLLTQASTDALYGAKNNPFHDLTVETGLWAIKKDLSRIMLGVLPNIFCSKGQSGRTALFAAFQRYYRMKGHENASRMVQTRYEVLRQYGLDEDDIAHFDLNICLGLLINTVPATFWTLFYVYSQPKLLEEVRTAIFPHIQSAAEGPTRHVNIAEVAAGCPLIVSIIHETLRVQSVSTSARKVLKDTVVNGQYLLKEDSTILVPSAEVHTTSSVWGKSSTTFDARRFCPNKTFESKRPTSAYRAFGGGAFLCPGRHLAVNEIITILVIMVLKYDVDPVDQTSWSWPKSQSSLATSILAPRDHIRVRMREREGYEAGLWKFEWKSRGTESEL